MIEPRKLKMGQDDAVDPAEVKIGKWLGLVTNENVITLHRTFMSIGRINALPCMQVILGAFISQYYLVGNGREIPKEIVISHTLEDNDANKGQKNTGSRAKITAYNEFGE